MTVDEATDLVEQVIDQGQLTKVQELVFRKSWDGESYTKMARASGYDPGYIKDTGSKLWKTLSEMYGIKVTKLNLQGALKRAVVKDRRESRLASGVSPRRVDWGDAIDVSIFYGRAEELATLRRWMVEESGEHGASPRCRLVTLLAMGGMGKTSLSVKIAEQVQDDFDAVIWRSLRDAPPLSDLLTTLIRFLAPVDQSERSLPESIGGKISVLIEHLRATRALVVLDNFEAVLQGTKRAGTYRSGYEDYGELLKRLGEIAHPSCVLITTREKPQEIAAQEGDWFPVRTLHLQGVDADTGRQIVVAKGLSADTSDLDRLVAHYRGNPLALKIAATSISDVFAGSITRFLAQGSRACSGMGTAPAAMGSAVAHGTADYVLAGHQPRTRHLRPTAGRYSADGASAHGAGCAGIPALAGAAGMHRSGLYPPARGDGIFDQKLAGFKPCPLGHKDNTIQLAVGHTDFNGRVSQCKTPVGAVGDDPSTHQESVNSGQTGNPRPKRTRRMSIFGPEHSAGLPTGRDPAPG